MPLTAAEELTRSCARWFAFGLLVAIQVSAFSWAGCAADRRQSPAQPRTTCEELLASEQEHPSAIRLPPAEYDFCRNQQRAQILNGLIRDGGISDAVAFMPSRQSLPVTQ
jgi:hypothetical protein